MYIEISSRGCGKTWRLYHAIESYLANSTSIRAAVLWTHNERSRQFILEGIKKEFRHLVLSPEQDYSKIKVKHFFDEFDYIGGLMEEHIMDDGYYATSPKRIRLIEELTNRKNDFLVNLLKENGFKYEVHFADFTQGNLTAAIEEIDKEVFERDFLATWLCKP